MSFPTQYIQSEPTDPGVTPAPGPGLAPAHEDVQVMDPVPGEAVDMLRQTRRAVGFVGGVGVTIGLLFTVPAATFAVLKWDTDNLLARKLGMAALGGFVWLIPALYLRAYARRIKRLIDYPTGDGLASALAAQKGFWRTACLLLTVVLMIAAGLLGRFVSSKGVRAVSDDVHSRVMAFIGKPTITAADSTPRVAATQPTATQPAATQPAATQPTALEPAVAATPAESNPPPPVQSGQASVETGETRATDK
jgi:hypothetical protein